MLLSSGSAWGIACASSEGLGMFRDNIAKLSEPWMDAASRNGMIKTLLWFYSSSSTGNPPFLNGLNEAENLSNCGDEAPCPRGFLHRTTHMFWERMGLFALLRAKPSSPSSYHIHSGLGTKQPWGKSCSPGKCILMHSWTRMNKADHSVICPLEKHQQQFHYGSYILATFSMWTCTI